MTNQTQQKAPNQLNMTIEGHRVTITFSKEYNPHVSQLVRNTLLDSYIRKNGICPDGSTE